MSKTFLAILALVVVIGLAAVAFVATMVDGDGVTRTSGDGEQTAAVELVGESIGPMPEGLAVTDPTTDPAAGVAAPELTGTTFGGEEITIGGDGRAKAVYFLAHWCSHCREEVPVVQRLIDDGQVPDGLDLYAVSTAVDDGQPNFPPQAWLDGEGFAPTTIRDDADLSAFLGFGGQGFPYVVYLDGDNRVVARSTGNLPPETIAALWELTAGS